MSWWIYLGRLIKITVFYKFSPGSWDLSSVIMMALSTRNIFRVIRPVCGAFTGHRWISCSKASDVELSMFSLICIWTNRWVNYRDAGDLRRHRAHYDVTVMMAREGLVFRAESIPWLPISVEHKERNHGINSHDIDILLVLQLQRREVLESARVFANSAMFRLGDTNRIHHIVRKSPWLLCGLIIGVHLWWLS